MLHFVLLGGGIKLLPVLVGLEGTQEWGFGSGGGPMSALDRPQGAHCCGAGGCSVCTSETA